MRGRPRRLAYNRTVIPQGSLVTVVVMFVVALLMIGGGVFFLLMGLARPMLRAGFVPTAIAFAGFGVAMVVAGLVMLKRRKQAQRTP